MHPSIKNWIFVTGAPRSATTFVGKMLSAGLRMDYIHEPFNPDCGITGIDEPYLYLEENDSRELELRPQIERLLDYKANLKTGYYRNDTPLRKFAKTLVGSRGPFYLRLARINPFHEGAVIKDPIGCLLTEYLLQRYRVKPVVIIRNPLGFVASVRRLQWEPSLAPLLKQTRLVERFFGASDLQVARRYEKGTTVQRAAVLWRLLNRALLAMASGNPQILVVTHEKICRQPLVEFEMIFAHAGLTFDQSARRRIVKYTSGDRVGAGSGKIQDFQRNSRGILQRSHSILGAAEVAEILSITAPVAESCYAPEALSA